MCEESDVESVIEIECSRWTYESVEYILDDATDNLYLNNDFIGKRLPGKFQGKYIIDFEAKDE